MRLKFKQIETSDIIRISMDTHSDNRGEVSEIYNQNQFHQHGILDSFIHEVENRSKFNVVRGFHYQARENQLSKLIRVVSGCYKCVFIDIRQSSDKLGTVYSQILDNYKEMVYVPIGYALGIQSLDHTNHFIYKMSQTYEHSYARSINPLKGTQSLLDSDGNSLSSILDEGTSSLPPPEVSETDKNAPLWDEYLKKPEY